MQTGGTARYVITPGTIPATYPPAIGMIDPEMRGMSQAKTTIGKGGQTGIVEPVPTVGIKITGGV